VPPVHPFTGPFKTRLNRKQAARGEGPRGLRWTLLDLDPERLRAERPDYVVYSPVEIFPYLAVGVEGVVEMTEILERDYVDAAGPWTNDLRLFGIPFDYGDGYARGWAPATTTPRILVRRER
jgi:hypothetical protein